MALPVLGLAVLLGLAAKLFLVGNAGRGEATLKAPAPPLPSVLATVDGFPLTREEVLAGLARDPAPTLDAIREAVGSLVEARLLSQAAEAMDPSGKAKLAPEAVLAEQVLVEPGEVETLWDRNRRIFWGDIQSVRHVSAATEGEAGLLRASLLAPDGQQGPPAAFPTVEQVGPGALAPELEQVLSSLQPGETSRPIQADGRYHVVQLIRRKPAVEVGFSDWQARLREAIRAERWHRERTRWLRLREACAEVAGDPRFLPPSPAEAQAHFLVHPETVAVVNGRDITRDDLLGRIRQARAMGKDGARHHHGHEPSEAEFRTALLKKIESVVVLQEGERRGVTLDERELDERYRALRSGFSSDAELEAMLRDNATSLEEWRRSMRNGLLLLKTEMTEWQRLPVDDAEVEIYWRENRAAFARDRIKGVRFDFEAEPAARAARARLDGGAPAVGEPPSRWFTMDQLPREVWSEAWAARPGAAIGPVRTPGGYVVMRITARQEADAQTAKDHREAITGILRRSRWLQEERLRWVLSLMERSTVWNRFDLTLKLGAQIPVVAGARGKSALVLVARASTCEAGLCEAVVRRWSDGVPLEVVTGPRAELIARDWNLPTLPWVFAVNDAGTVVGECAGPITEAILTRLASRLSSTHKAGSEGGRSARSVEVRRARG